MAAAAAAAKTSQWLAGEPSSGRQTATTLSLVVAGGLIEGTALGSLQAFGLRRWLPALNTRRWVLVTIAVAGTGWAAASTPAALGGGDTSGPGWPLLVTGAVALGAVMGAVLGGAQALVLRHVVRFPRRWVDASMLGWAPAMVVIFAGATAPPAGWPALAVTGLGAATGLAAGAVLGAVTGWFLPSLSGPPPHNRAVLALLSSPAHRLADRSLLGLRVRGTVTGTQFDLPVMFATADGTLVVMPGRPGSKRWWRNLRHPCSVRVLRHGRWQPATGAVLRPGVPGYATALAAYRQRWPRTPATPGCPLVLITLTGSGR